MCLPRIGTSLQMGIFSHRVIEIEELHMVGSSAVSLLKIPIWPEAHKKTNIVARFDKIIRCEYNLQNRGWSLEYFPIKDLRPMNMA